MMRIQTLLVVALFLPACVPAASPADSSPSKVDDLDDFSCPLPNEFFHVLVDEGVLSTSNPRLLLPDSVLTELEEDWRRSEQQTAQPLSE